jgi:hypothetical integral membrane protein (TIGR02206 family)
VWPIIVTTAVSVLLALGARRRGEAFALPARRALALLIAAGFVTEQIVYAARGLWSAEVNLPLQLSDAVTFVSVAALLHPGKPLLVELTYFWALTASLQAVITPDLNQAFPDVLYFTYFATHCGAIAAACLLVFGERRIPRRGAVWRVYGITIAFAACAALGTVLTGGNYLFLRRKPVHGSLLDAMGPWPLYIVVAAAFGLVLLLALAWLASTSASAAAARAGGGGSGGCD